MEGRERNFVANGETERLFEKWPEIFGDEAGNFAAFGAVLGGKKDNQARPEHKKTTPENFFK